MNGNLNLEVVVSELFDENAYLAYLTGRPDCLVFDPGSDYGAIIARLRELQLTPAAIINTHGHADHIVGNAQLKRTWPEAPIVIGAGDARKLTDPVANLSRGYGIDVVSPPADRLLREGDRFQAAGIELEVYEAPGHSVGHILLVHKGSKPFVVFGGDVLFQGSIGRTDFPDGSFEKLAHAIRTRLYTLPDDTLVLPGHGPSTTIGDEKRSNPFVSSE